MRATEWIVLVLFAIMACHGLEAEQADVKAPGRLIIVNLGLDERDSFSMLQFDLSTGEETARFSTPDILDQGVLYYLESLNRFLLFQKPAKSSQGSPIYVINARNCSNLGKNEVPGLPFSYRIDPSRQLSQPDTSSVIPDQRRLYQGFQFHTFFINSDQKRLFVAASGNIPKTPPKMMAIDLDNGSLIQAIDLGFPIQRLVPIAGGNSALGIMQGSWYEWKSANKFIQRQIIDDKTMRGKGFVLFYTLDPLSQSGMVELPSEGTFDPFISPDGKTAFIVDDDASASHANVHVVSLESKSLLGSTEIGWSPLRDKDQTAIGLVSNDRLAIACHGEPRNEVNNGQSSETPGRLYVVSAKGEKRVIDLGTWTSLLDWGRDQNEALVGWKGHLAIVDLATPKTKAVVGDLNIRGTDQPAFPERAAIAPNKRFALLSFMSSGMLAVIDLQEAKVVATLDIGEKWNIPSETPQIEPYSVESFDFEPDSSLAYVYVKISNDNDHIYLPKDEMLLKILDMNSFSIKGSHSIGSSLSTWKDGSERYFFSGNSEQRSVYSFKAAASEKIEFIEHPSLRGLAYASYSPGDSYFIGLTPKWELILVDPATGVEAKRLKLKPGEPKLHLFLKVYPKIFLNKPFQFYLLKNSGG